MGILRSMDAGASWVHLTAPDLIDGSDWERASLAFSPSNPDIVVVMVTDGDSTPYVYRSTNATVISPNIPDWVNISPSDGDFDAAMHFHAHTLTIHPDNSQKYYIGSVNLAHTSDGGQTWTRNIQPGHADLTRLYFSPDVGSSHLWICNDGGIYAHNFSNRTTYPLMGGSNGLNLAQLNGMDADRLMRVAGMQDNGVVRSTNAGGDWDVTADGGDGFGTTITDAEEGTFWFNDGWYRVVGTILWRSLLGQNPEEVVYPGENINYALFYDPRDDRLYAPTNTGIISRDQSASTTSAWTTEIVDGLQPETYYIWFIRGNPVHGQTIYVAYRTQPQYGPGNGNDITILRKQNGRWTIIHREDFEPSVQSITGMYPSEQFASEFWVTVESPVNSPKILHTTDDGATWKDVSGNLSSLNAVRSLAITPFNPLVMYAGTDVGMFRTEDGGRSWQPFNEGLPIVMGNG